MPASTRLLLGLAAAACVVAGAVLMIQGDNQPNGGVLVRVGLLLGAAWLVAPLVRRPSWATLGFVVAGVLVLIRPRLIVAVVIGAAMWWWAKRRT